MPPMDRPGKEGTMKREPELKFLEDLMHDVFGILINAAGFVVWGVFAVVRWIITNGRDR